jgi:sigma-B regulation protein RsbU (phosphoserine phosphatase)
MAVKILSVDDELDLEVLLTQFFRREIRKEIYEFYFAHNGLEALKVMLEHPDIEIILSDINMPEMDGLTLLTKINEMRNPLQKCIMVSAYGDMENIRTAMNRGAFDFATKPIDLDDLSLTIKKAIEQIKFIKATQREHNQLESIKGDLAVAHEIQQAILPQVFPPFPDLADKVDIFASMNPAKDVGGDFYDFFMVDDTHIGFVMADVSGKGVPAALFMAVSRTIIRATGIQKLPSDECMTIANELLSKESLDSMFVTVFYGILDTETGLINYTNAGHNPPMLLHADGHVEELPYSQNFIVGVFDDFKYKQAQLQLQHGDVLFTFTDGVTEAFNTAKDQFGEMRLRESLTGMADKSSEEITIKIYHDVKAHAGDEPQSDDITILTIIAVR